jgi:hypothetical protein
VIVFGGDEDRKYVVAQSLAEFFALFLELLEDEVLVDDTIHLHPQLFKALYEEAPRRQEDAQTEPHEPQQPTYRIPTVYGQACPECGSRDLMVKKVRFGYGMAAAPEQLRGINTAELAQKHSGNFEKALNPLVCRCRSCKKAFESLPVVAPASELLDEPCTIHFERTFNLKGALMPVYVFINGICLSPVSTGRRIMFQTPLRHNTVFVTDGLSMHQIGRTWSLEASGGEEVLLRFSNKFKSASMGSFEPSTGFSAYSDVGLVAEAKDVYEQVKDSKKPPKSYWVMLVISVLLAVATTVIPSWFLVRELNQAGRQWEKPAEQLIQEKEAISRAQEYRPPALPDTLQSYYENSSSGEQVE